MAKSKPRLGKTIDQVLAEFLAEQKRRLSHSTTAKYETIVSLFKSYCESYWPGHDGESDRVTKAGGTYCGTYGPEDIVDGYSEFLGYFMPRKVVAGKETMTAAGTVTKKLAQWLVAKGYIREAEDAVEEAGRAAKELPASQDVFDLLAAYIDTEGPSDDECQRLLEDHFWIKRIEPGKLWLEPFISASSTVGPVPVSEEVTQGCKVDWDIGGVLGKTDGGWRFVEVWSVSP